MRMSLLVDSLGPGKVIAKSLLYIFNFIYQQRASFVLFFVFFFFLFGGGWGEEKEVICSSLQINNLLLTILAARFSRVHY